MSEISRRPQRRRAYSRVYYIDMQAINLQNIPNQEFSIMLEGVLFDLTLRAINDCMYCDVTANGNPVVSGARCVAGYQIMPYLYQEGISGNFTFQTLNYELPWWEEFGISQYLIYATASDLASVRANVSI